MHALLIAVSLFAQVSISREAAVDPAAADKTYAAMSASLDDEVRHKLDRVHVQMDVKTAREAVTKALPGANLSPEATDALAFYVLSRSAERVAAETKRIAQQRDDLRAAMKAAGLKPEGSPKFAMRLSDDYAQAPEPLPADATPAAMAERLTALGAMIDVNTKALKTIGDRRMSAYKGHDVTLNAIRNMK